MKIKYFFFILVFICGTSIHAQRKTDSITIKPTSIYTFSKFSNHKNSFSAINKRLNLINLKFVFVDIIDSDLNQFSVETNNLGKTSSKFISDDYNRFINRNLLKGFLFKNDPTRWNLQCSNPLSVQPSK